MKCWEIKVDAEKAKALHVHIRESERSKMHGGELIIPPEGIQELL